MRLWKQLQAALPRLGIVGLVIALIAGIVAAAYFGAVFPDWTGFGPPLLDAQGHELPRAKTLWDWMGLLLVPAVLAVGGYFLTRSENNEARKREAERAQDAALQAYLDQMTQLLLHEKLRTSKADDEVRSVARARTLAVLRALDGRRLTVLQFLYEVGLIGGIKQEDGGVPETIDAIVSLAGAKLEGAYLNGANLTGANLFGAYLENANLNGAHLRDAILFAANLEGAKLEGANLSCANLANCKVTREQLAEVRSLEGATLPFAL